MRRKFTQTILFAAVAAAVLGLPKVSAQEFKWAFRFDTRFDDREFDPIKREGAVGSATYFSVRLTPVVGIGWNENHSVMVGGSFTFDMGAPLDKRTPELLLYYNFHNPRYGAYAGKFERRKLIGAYSRAIYAGGHYFYDDVIDGFALQYTPGASYMELVLDWDGMQSATTRESFRILSAGEFNPENRHWARWFTAGYSLDVYHLASSAEATEGVVDHILVEPWVGAAFHRLGDIWLDKLSLKVGWVQSFDRERRGENVWKTPGGPMVDLTIEKKRVGIRSRLYTGDHQLPFWYEYGSRIYKGDPMYAVFDGFYNFTQVYWRPQLTKGVRLDLDMGFHFDRSGLGLHPLAWIGVTLDNGMFGKKKKRIMNHE